MVDTVAMPTGIKQKKYLVLVQEDLTNQVEGRALRRKTCSAVCQFPLEEVLCRYGCVGQVIVDGGELDSDKARGFFAKHGVRLTLTTTHIHIRKKGVHNGRRRVMGIVVCVRSGS